MGGINDVATITKTFVANAGMVGDSSTQDIDYAVSRIRDAAEAVNQKIRTVKEGDMQGRSIDWEDVRSKACERPPVRNIRVDYTDMTVKFDASPEQAQEVARRAGISVFEERPTV